METKVKKNKMKRIKHKLRLLHGLTVFPIGKKGGLALLWSQAVELKIIHYSQYHIHAKLAMTLTITPGSLPNSMEI